jgi:putative transposase
MTSHIHLIVSNDQNDLPSVVRDFKTFTSKGLIKLIKTISESRRVWLLKKFAYEADRNVRATNYKLWQDGFHPIELSTNEMMDQKLNYLPNAGRYSLQSG